MKNLLLVLLLIISTEYIHSQSFYFGPKLGPGLGFQRWNQNENDPLFGINADLFLESYSEDSKGSLFISAGYRTRGSAWRTGTIGSQFSFNSLKFKFNNAVIEVGAKKILKKESDYRPFYYIGFRGEYNLNTNLKQYEGELYFPQEVFVRNFVYGPSFGGGYEMKFRDLMDFFIELNLSSDIRSQYFQPTLYNVRDPFLPGQLRTVEERNISNYTIEVKFGFKFLRKVIYEE
jgi:hypothetical protein